MRRLLCMGLLIAGAAQAQDDPHQWLEAVQDEKALAFAATHSQRTEAMLRATPGFEALREGLHEVLASPARLAPVNLHGGLAYNFWRDAAHPRGIWRRTPLAAYRAGKPQWQTVLDLDQLSRDEGEAWNWGSASCQHGVKAPRCMLALSRGGGDAKVFREFDLGRLAFVPGGFTLP
ncbi:MAG: S9 family peptidase, partial [Burkholderiales bacterium]|nr:S9 family peptidase [Burkholderiales bacterium]